MRHDGLVVYLRQVADFEPFGNAARLDEIGVDDVGFAFFDQILDHPAGVALLARHDGDRQGIHDRGQIVQVFVGAGTFVVLHAPIL